MDDRFWAALEPRSAEDLRATLSAVKGMFEPTLRQFTPGEPSMRALEELLATLQRERIRAALILAPMGPTVRSLYPKESLDLFLRDVIRLTEQHDCGYVDASAWLAEEMFTDSVHATAAGADVFSDRLAREVLVPALQVR
jgi:hypothetical protein